MQLTVILPCYNPLPDWEQQVLAGVRKVEAETGAIELILVNDGSDTDMSAAIHTLREQLPGLKYLHYEPNKGKGYAIRAGVAQATGKFIIYTDIDFPYTHTSFMQVYRTLISDKCDIAIGVKDSRYYEHVPPLRRLTSRTLRFMTSLVLRISITDTQCGLKGLNRHAADILLQGQVNRYLSDLELICNAERKQLRLKPVPVSLREGVTFSKVKMKILARELTNFISIMARK